ncbi:MAG: hypothetical protein ABI597_14085 [Gammaproteobacteria bacterium]
MSSNRDLFIEKHKALFEYLDNCIHEGVHYLTDDTEKGVGYRTRLGRAMKHDMTDDNLIFLSQIATLYKRFATPPRDGSISTNNEESVDYQYSKEEKIDGYESAVKDEVRLYYKTFFIDKAEADHADLINIDYADKTELKAKYDSGTLTLLDFLPAVTLLKRFMDSDVLPRYKTSFLEAKATHSTTVVQRSLSAERSHRGGVLDSSVHFENIGSHIKRILAYLHQLAHQLGIDAATQTSSQPKLEMTAIEKHNSEITTMLNGIWQTTWSEFCKPIIYTNIERAQLEPLQSSIEEINRLTKQINDTLSKDIPSSIHDTVNLVSGCFKQCLVDLKAIRNPEEKHEAAPVASTTKTETRTHTPNGTKIDIGSQLSAIVHKGLNFLHRHRSPTTDSNSSNDHDQTPSASEPVSGHAPSGKDRPPMHPKKDRPGHS